MNNTSHLIGSQNNSMSHLVLLEDGQKMEKLDVSDQTMENASTTSMMSQKSLVSNPSNQTPVTPSVMHVSVLSTKKKILTDKSTCSNNITQMQESSKTLALDSIGIDQDLKPFWNSSTQKMSQRLWLPTKTDCVDLATSSWNGSSEKLMLKSWFSTRMMTSKTSLENSQMIFLQSLQSLLQKTMDLEQLTTENKETERLKKQQIQKQKRDQRILELQALETSEARNERIAKHNLYLARVEKREVAKTKRTQRAQEKCHKQGIQWEEPVPKQQPSRSLRVRIYPDKTQKQTLREWFGVRRWIYNKCLSVMKTGVNPTQEELRKRVVNNNNFEAFNTWMLNYDYDLRDEAMRDFVKNIDSNKAKGKSFEMRYKSKRDHKQSISVLGKKWNKPKNFYSPVFNPSKLVSSEDLPTQLKYTSRLVHTASNKYFLCIPQPTELQSDNQAHKNMIFIDPGQVDFATCFDPSGKIVVCGEGDSSRIAKLLHWRRKLTSKISKTQKTKTKRRLSIALFRLNEHIDNLVKELHKKLALWLCQNYQTIYIPRLNFHNCKNLNKRSRSVLASLQHCEFVNRLIHKSKEFKNCQVIEVNEACTTKTCGNCGNYNLEIKSNRSYDCKKCGISIGRDVNASRNIMLRYFTNKFKLSLE